MATQWQKISCYWDRCFLLGHLEGSKQSLFPRKIIKSSIEILCHAGALMRFWAGLYAKVDKEMLVNGVNTMLRVVARFILSKDNAGGQKRLGSGEDDEAVN